jgi:hypothetical protein
MLLFPVFVGAQNTVENTQLKHKDLGEPERWNKNNIFPILPDFQMDQDRQQDKYTFQKAPDKKSLNDYYVWNEGLNNTLKMPVLRLNSYEKPFNMPVSIPDSTVNFAIKVKKLGFINPLDTSK